MLNFHARDVILISCIAGACTAGGFVLGGMWEKKRAEDERKAKQMPPEQLTKDSESLLTPDELQTWAAFSKDFEECTHEVQWKNEWMQEGGRIIPDYWNERDDIGETNIPKVSKFTDEFGRRGLMCRITANDGFVVYETFIAGGKPTYLTCLSETHHATHAMPYLELLTTILEAQKIEAENKAASDKAAAEVADAIEKARNAGAGGDAISAAAADVDNVTNINANKQV